MTEFEQLQARVQFLEEAFFKMMKRDHYSFERDIRLGNGRSIIFSKGNGGKIGKTTTDKIGFFGTTPVAQQAALTAEDGATVDATYGSQEAGVISNTRTRVGEIETALSNLGLIS